MHIRLVNFLRKNKLLLCHQFGFRNGYSVNHTLTSMTELIRKALDEDKFACEVFIDLQKAFEPVDQNILLSKLYHYGVKGTPHQWFKSYLTGRQQYTTINHQKASLSNIKYGVPQGSVLGPLLLLLCVNDLNKAVVHSNFHHFADGTNVLYASHSLKNLNKTVNFDLSNLVQWLRANKISLNVNKTVIVVFRSSTKQIYKNLNFRLSGQKIEPKRCTKYSGVDKHLSFNEYMNTLKQKLNRASGILAKLRYYVTADVLKTIYYAFFDSHMKYACHIWGQVENKTFHMIQRAQNKALRIISFKQFMEPSEPLYNQLKIRPGQFPGIAGNAGNHENDGKFPESYKILNQI